jgi:predicted DCC family thiol-disulfide oxidoreductase YuxK
VIVEPQAPERIFYDGSCGLCHRGVRFVVRRDPEGRAFRFAPLGGPTFAREVDPAIASGLPDSFVIVTRDGRVLPRSDGALHVLAALGGIWRVLAAVGKIVPRGVRDFLYDRIAAVRKRLFRPPADACPVAPAELRRRFDP